ncbi:transposase [Flavobacterium frigoris]|uniref:REP element-mobilizing transposase RayT n=1 Tax=Flavobacterium frigoris TaxID=229204 RepID=A0A1H9PJ38_FLAFI|nr:transposase [Flavobacterium frigoris]SER47573.1 REP element-mobilizing transposase RayT [Flavobacterium frigoris]
MKKFQNKYRIPSARLQNWDYGSNGAYFITICTHKTQHFFGKVATRLIASAPDDSNKKNEMQLNELGKIAHSIWAEIPNQFPYVELGNFVIMPNHMHGILIINKNGIAINAAMDPAINGGFAGNHNPMLQENISRIIRWYKGRCSFEMRKIHADFNWQSRFHDHVIRDSKAFENIQNYIEQNPAKWAADKFYNLKI